MEPEPGFESVRALAIDPSNPQTIYAGTGSSASDGVYKSTDGAASWSASGSGLDNPTVNALAIAPSRPQTLYAATRFLGVFKTVDGAASWTSVNDGLGEALAQGSDFTAVSWDENGLSESIQVLANDPSNPDLLYAGGAIAGLFQSEQGPPAGGGGGCAATSRDAGVVPLLAAMLLGAGLRLRPSRRRRQSPFRRRRGAR